MADKEEFFFYHLFFECFTLIKAPMFGLIRIFSCKYLYTIEKIEENASAKCCEQYANASRRVKSASSSERQSSSPKRKRVCSPSSESVLVSFLHLLSYNFLVADDVSRRHIALSYMMVADEAI